MPSGNPVWGSSRGRTLSAHSGRMLFYLPPIVLFVFGAIKRFLSTDMMGGRIKNESEMMSAAFSPTGKKVITVMKCC
jgi:hypothetical protein